VRVKKATSIRLTPEAKSILSKLAAQLGVSMTSVIELAIRDFAKKNDAQRNRGTVGRGKTR